MFNNMTVLVKDIMLHPDSTTLKNVTLKDFYFGKKENHPDVEFDVIIDGILHVRDILWEPSKG